MGFTVILTPESSQSSSDSDYEYYQTEIFEQLPSTRAIHSSQNTQPVQERGPEPGSSISSGLPSSRLKDKESAQPLKSMALCIQAKREVRWEGTFLHLNTVSYINTFKNPLKKMPAAIELKMCDICIIYSKS